MADTPTPLPARVSLNNIAWFLAAAQKGRDSALGKLLSYYKRYLRGIAREKLPAAIHRKVDLSDVVQDTIVLAWTRFREALPGTEAEIRDRLTKMLVNRIRALSRRYGQRTKRDVSKEELFDEQQDNVWLFRLASRKSVAPSSGPEQQDMVERVYRALGSLPKPHQQIILWHARDGHTFVDIAARLDRSSDAVRMFYQRAVAKLQKLLAGDE